MFTNDSMDFGNKNEDEAVETLSVSIESRQKFKSGLIVHPALPWLGGTPDIIFIDKDGIMCTGEVKCPSSLDPFGNTPEKRLIDMDYIMQDDSGNFHLNDKHDYYLQCQLQCFLTKSPHCYFYVHSKNPENCCELKIPRKDDFL